MLDLVFVTFVLVGTSYAAYVDLKTSEVSDAVSLIIGGGAILFYLFHSLSRPLISFTPADLALILATASFTAGVVLLLRLYRPLFAYLRDHRYIDGTPEDVLEQDVGPVVVADGAAVACWAVTGLAVYLSTLYTGVTPLALSLLSGTALFGLGWGMYLAGLWGGADAFVLGAVGFAFPYLPVDAVMSDSQVMPVPLSLLMLVFAVGSVYSVVYALYMAVRDGDAMTAFWQQLRSERRRLVSIAGGYMVVALILGQGMHVMYGIPVITILQSAVQFLVVLAALLVVFQFLRVVEEDVMRQTIPVDELEPGDVLADELEGVEPEAGDRIVGLTPEQVERIQEQYDTVDIRSGVRFIVAFPIAIILLLLIGDPIHALSGML